MTNQLKKKVESLFNELNRELDKLGLEIDHHAEFVSLIKDKKTRELIAVLYEDNEIDWEPSDS